MANHLPEGASVLVILTGALGDVARGMCVPSILKRERPDLTITWLVEERWRPIVELSPAVDRVIGFARNTPVKGFLAVRRELKQAGPFDCSLDLQRHFKSGWFSFFGGAKLRIGFSRENAKEGNWLFNNHYIAPIDNQQSKVIHYLSFLDALGIRASTSEPYFHMDKKRCIDAVKPLFQKNDGPYISLILGTSWRSKDWVQEGYEQLISKLANETEATIVLCGDRSQTTLSEKITGNHSSRVLNLVGKTDLVELCGALALSSVAIGPDTGPGHLVAMFGKKYIGLFGPTDPARVVPYGSEALAQVPPVPCHPCWRRECPGLNRVCMRLHSVETISQLAKGCLSR